MMRDSWITAAALLVALVAPAPAQTSIGGGAPSLNTLTDAERAAGWRLLFDGRTLTGWRGLGRDTVPTAHWVIVDGAIRKIPSGVIPRRPDGQPVAGGDLMSVDAYRDFELTWEWKVTPGANSG